MKTLTWRVLPLSTEIADAARRAAVRGAPDHAMMVADSPDAVPCRHCLQFAKPGERVILFPYASIPAGHPYSETGPIFVHAEPCERYGAIDEFPAELRVGRALRAYNAQLEMIEAVANASEPEEVTERLFENVETAFVDVRSVTRGCYTFRIERQ